MKGKRTVMQVVWVCLALTTGCALWCGNEAAAETPIIEVTQGSKITANVDNSRLGEVLRLMANKRLFEIRGSVSSREEISIHFTDLSLEAALKKLLRGYNYVLFQTEATRAPTLMVMGRVTSGGGYSQRAEASSSPPASAMTALATAGATPAEPSVLAEQIPERPVKTRRALPTRLGAHIASFRSAAVQSRAALAAANMAQEDGGPETSQGPAPDGETTKSGESLNGQSVETPRQ
jgi:hypothetical protein